MNIDEHRVIHYLNIKYLDMQIKHLCIPDVKHCTYKYQRSAKMFVACSALLI